MTFGITIEVNSDGTFNIRGLEKNRTSRDFKGKSLIKFPDSFCLIDIETTGLDPRFDEIIEIAAIKVEDGKVVDELSSLVKPLNPIDSFITNLTGISNEMVEDANPIEIVLTDFMDFWKGYILVGHNVNFDINFLYDNCINAFNEPLQNDFVDTLRIARRLLPELENHQLKTLLNYFNIADDTEHRALEDAKNTLAIFNELKAICLRDYDSISSFTKSFSKNGTKKGLQARDITTTKINFDESHPFYNKTFVFTGTLEKMVRREAMQLVVDLGGKCADNVTKNTDYLVLGNQDYTRIKGNKSSKHKKAEQLKITGQDIEIISENVFYDMLD